MCQVLAKIYKTPLFSGLCTENTYLYFPAIKFGHLSFFARLYYHDFFQPDLVATRNMPFNYVIFVYDVGTSGVKSVVWNSQGQMSGFAYERLETIYGDNGQATQDPQVVFAVLIRV
eukprot:TRINITY_DN5673_c0_g1_i11.p1 TRINITY_DN5673_c0_g1~~TRINITY_DN5673_c0_g1_i11.p1  ORF type:complete len:116 (-),score=0.39 TRINITY_DN5673_c0_g1_i11:30-377(-)